jgi:hypothetical protein
LSAATVASVRRRRAAYPDTIIRVSLVSSSPVCEDGSAWLHPVPFGGKTVHWTVFCPAALPQN